MKNLSKIKNYISNYKFNSLFFQNMKLIFLLMIVPLMGAGFLAYFSYANMQKNNIYSYGNTVTTDAYDTLQDVLTSAQTELVYIGFNSNVELYMYDTEEIRQFNYRIASIQDLMRLPVLSKDYIDNIYIYSYNNKKILSPSTFEDYSNSLEKSRLDLYLNSGNTSPALMLTNNSTAGNGKKQLTLFQPVRYGNHVSGISWMNLNLEELNAVFDFPAGDLLLFTNKDQILWSNHPEWIGTSKSDIPGIEALKDQNSVIQNNQILTSVKSEQPSLEVITSMSLNGYTDQLGTIRIFMILFLLLLLVCMLILAIYISIRLFHPIDEIIKEIQKNQSILMGENALFQEQNELAYILHSIQKTVTVKKDIDQELVDRVRLLKKAQAIALQSQINPHFLNNTLDTINWISIGLLGGKNQISEMTTALSRMLRMTLENTDSIVPLSLEIEHCNYYLQIQNIRYEGKYEIKWTIPEDLYSYKTIRIILQPVVENAIYHGVKYLSGNGLITVSGKARDGIVELVVGDNGLGMNPSELSELRQHLAAESIRESKHIGLANVNQRLRLYFGDEYGIFIESQEGVGTQVFIRFPQISD